MRRRRRTNQLYVSLLAALLAFGVATAACSRSAPTTDPHSQTSAGESDAGGGGGGVSSSSPSSEGDARAFFLIPGPPQVDPPGVYMGRTLAPPMSYLGADWLDRADRDATQQPEHVLDVLGIKPGMTVADVGCGSGYFTVHLAKRVGPTGRVIATDLQQEMLDLLKKKLDASKIQNVTSRLATPEDTKLAPGELDLVLMVDVYHEVPNPPLTLAQISVALTKKPPSSSSSRSQAMKEVGRLALVEYRAEDPKVQIKAEHKTTLVQLRRELEANRFMFIASDESLPEQRIVQFKPGG